MMADTRNTGYRKPQALDRVLIDEAPVTYGPEAVVDDATDEYETDVIPLGRMRAMTVNDEELKSPDGRPYGPQVTTDISSVRRDIPKSLGRKSVRGKVTDKRVLDTRTHTTHMSPQDPANLSDEGHVQAWTEAEELGLTGTDDIQTRNRAANIRDTRSWGEEPGPNPYEDSHAARVREQRESGHVPQTQRTGTEKSIRRKSISRKPGDPNVDEQDNPPQAAQAPPEEQAYDQGEPYGAQVCRRLHEDSMLLLEEYDQMAPMLEHPETKKLLMKGLQNLVGMLDALEANWDKNYPQLAPLAGREVPVDPNADPNAVPVNDGMGNSPDVVMEEEGVDVELSPEEMAMIEEEEAMAAQGGQPQMQGQMPPMGDPVEMGGPVPGLQPGEDQLVDSGGEDERYTDGTPGYEDMAELGPVEPSEFDAMEEEVVEEDPRQKRVMGKSINRKMAFHPNAQPGVRVQVTPIAGDKTERDRRTAYGTVTARDAGDPEYGEPPAMDVINEADGQEYGLFDNEYDVHLAPQKAITRKAQMCKTCGMAQCKCMGKSVGRKDMKQDEELNWGDEGLSEEEELDLDSAREFLDALGEDTSMLEEEQKRLAYFHHKMLTRIMKAHPGTPEWQQEEMKSYEHQGNLFKAAKLLGRLVHEKNFGNSHREQVRSIRKDLFGEEEMVEDEYGVKSPRRKMALDPNVQVGDQVRVRPAAESNYLARLTAESDEPGPKAVRDTETRYGTVNSIQRNYWDPGDHAVDYGEDIAQTRSEDVDKMGPGDKNLIRLGDGFAGNPGVSLEGDEDRIPELGEVQEKATRKEIIDSSYARQPGQPAADGHVYVNATQDVTDHGVEARLGEARDLNMTVDDYQDSAHRAAQLREAQRRGREPQPSPYEDANAERERLQAESGFVPHSQRTEKSVRHKEVSPESMARRQQVAEEGTVVGGGPQAQVQAPPQQPYVNQQPLRQGTQLSRDTVREIGKPQRVQSQTERQAARTVDQGPRTNTVTQLQGGVTGYRKPPKTGSGDFQVIPRHEYDAFVASQEGKGLLDAAADQADQLGQLNAVLKNLTLMVS